MTLQALPAPGGGMNKRDWASPTVQGEFQAWTTRLNRWGVSITQQELEQNLWDVAIQFMRIRRQAFAPYFGYSQNAGTWQSWRMFVAPHRYPSRLHIDILQMANGDRSMLRGQPPTIGVHINSTTTEYGRPCFVMVGTENIRRLVWIHSAGWARG